MTYQLKNFSELDFEEIKASLKQYLQTQDAFVGFDFEGTAINALINVLAYNTQYNAFYLNMHASERFLTTAQRRENVVSLAKNLGYSPYASKGSIAAVSIQAKSKEWFTETKLTVPKHTLFKASNEDKSLTFYTQEAYDLVYDPTIVEPNPSVPPRRFYVGQVNVFEGKKFTQTFTMTEGETGFTLPNINVQTDKLTVAVTNGSTTEIWNQSSTFTNLSPSSQAYFVEEVIGQKTRISFGDNIVGKRPTNGSTITVVYFTSSGTEGNNAISFTFADSLTTADSVVITSLSSKSYGAVDVETMDSIRANAPLMFETQGRAVTAQDFKAILNKLVPSAHTISVWGGEDEIGEPRLGYVFLTWVTEEELLQLSQGIDVSRSQTEKDYVQTELRTKYATVTIFPEVKNPQFVFLTVSTKVYYDSTKNTTVDEVKDLVKNSIKDYYNQNISKFQTTLRYSRLTAAIDNASQFITSNDLYVGVYQQKDYAPEAALGITIGVPLKEGTLRSTYFSYTIGSTTRQNSFISDRFITGTQPTDLYLWYRDGDVDKTWLVNSQPVKVGTINRDTGVISFQVSSNFNMSTAQGITELNKFIVSAETMFKDLDLQRNLLAVLKDTDIKIEVVAD